MSVMVIGSRFASGIGEAYHKVINNARGLGKGRGKREEGRVGRK